MNVQILSRKLITPSSPTPRHLQKLKISWLDQFLSPHNYLPFIFYFPSHGDENNVERSKQLQNSLSETLTIFYPLAGRYIDNNLIVHCNDKGVGYTEAKVSGCLSQFLEGGELETELRNRLAPHPVQPDNSALVLIQFNMFESGGVAIGLCVTHRAADAYTVFTFVRTWATVLSFTQMPSLMCKIKNSLNIYLVANCIPEPVLPSALINSSSSSTESTQHTACRLGVDKVPHAPSFQLPSFFPSRDTISSPNRFINRNHKIVVMKRFVFTGPALSKLKAVVSGSVNGSHQPTRIEVVTAVIWKTSAMVARAKHGRLRPSLLSHTFNMRGKIAMPVPDNSCGNFINVALSHFTEDDESKVQLHDFVDRVYNGIKKMVSDCAKVSTDDELFVMAEKIRIETIKAFTRSEMDLYMFNSWCRMPVYEADFGWGKPGWVSGLYVPGVEMVFLVDTKDGDGIEAWVSLEEATMLLFQENPEIKASTGQE
ncbi:hypothetical protein SADUNF_Sadunf15G0107000 [Salix dunnii]|uniref:Uncharacterized protein n=1 Tax=Salix dunnii TaxID=1413687 RepID=A0A835MJL8_9ROSI|nr:hypothetical protein SADUNF_Sadunf15G0107000 [Salix dunnii]